MYYLVGLAIALISAHAVYSQQDSATITVAPKDQKVAEGETVSFICKASGIPAPDVYWRKNGKLLTSDQIHYTTITIPDGSLLRIEAVRSVQDDTVLECVVENGVGDRAVAMATLEIYPEENIPEGYPRITQSPTLKAVEKGRNVVMVCSATGSPDPSISWNKYYIPLDMSDSRMELLPGGSLKISNSTESDEGKYECVAENSVGVNYSYSANLYVRVRRVPPYFSILPESIEVSSGDSANLTCVAFGTPVPQVSWQLGSVDLTSVGETAPLMRNVLVLNDIKESQTYTCVAVNTYGSIEYDAVVTVNEIHGLGRSARNRQHGL